MDNNLLHCFPRVFDTNIRLLWSSFLLNLNFLLKKEKVIVEKYNKLISKENLLQLKFQIPYLELEVLPSLKLQIKRELSV